MLSLYLTASGGVTSPRAAMPPRSDPVIAAALLEVVPTCMSLGWAPAFGLAWVIKRFIMAKGKTWEAEPCRIWAAGVAYPKEGVGKEKQNLAPFATAQAPKPHTAQLSQVCNMQGWLRREQAQKVWVSFLLCKAFQLVRQQHPLQATHYLV